MTRQLGIAALVLISGCAVTDTGNPNYGPEIDDDRVEAMSLFGGIVNVLGQSGAITPAEGTLRITNLNSENDPTDAVVMDDGSFSASIVAELGDVLRLQVIGVEDRSAPLDITSSGVPLDHELAECLVLDPELEMIAAGPSATIEIQNDCDETVTFAAPRMRREPEGFSITISEMSAFELAAGNRVSITLAIVLNAPGEFEEVLLVDTTAPAIDQRPITVRVIGP